VRLPDTKNSQLKGEASKIALVLRKPKNKNNARRRSKEKIRANTRR